MSNTTTKHMLSMYEQGAAPVQFLTGFFRTPAENFYNSETVEVDVERSGEDIAIAIQDLSVGPRMNGWNLYTNKEFTAPIYEEAFALNAWDLIKREAGQDPFQSPDFQGNATARAFSQFRKIEAKIRRAIEEQASQVLQTGTVTLKDANGNAIYTIDYKPKTVTHFPTAGTAWGVAGADPIGDLLSLSEAIRDDGQGDPDTIIMGSNAWEKFIANSDVQLRFDNRRIELGTIAPMRPDGNGGNYRGTIEIGNYKLDVWTYGGRYKDPETGTITPYVNTGKVIMMISGSRYDATFGAIPRLRGPETAALPYLPERMAMPGARLDLWTNAYFSLDGKQLFVSAGARPLLIPTAIDTYGCLTAIP